jgi:hypothetical protein
MENINDVKEVQIIKRPVGRPRNPVVKKAPKIPKVRFSKDGTRFPGWRKAQKLSRADDIKNHKRCPRCFRKTTLSDYLGSLNKDKLVKTCKYCRNYSKTNYVNNVKSKTPKPKKQKIKKSVISSVSIMVLRNLIENHYETVDALVEGDIKDELESLKRMYMHEHPFDFDWEGVS